MDITEKKNHDHKTSFTKQLGTLVHDLAFIARNNPTTAITI